MANRSIIRCLLVLATVFIFSSCVRENEWLADNVQIIAHRGYHLSKLENTYESFEDAYQRGYKYVEFDIHFTKDFLPVILHENALDNQSDTTGSINDMYFSDVQNINLIGGYKIPSFEIALQRFYGKFLTFIIDMKEPCSDSGLINLASLIKKYDAYTKTIITCTNPEKLLKLKKIDKNLILGNNGVNFEDDLNECLNQKNKHVTVYYPQLDKHLCFIAKANGIKVFAYPPNSQQQMLQSLSYDIDGIMTDNPDLLKQLLK